MQEFIFNFQVLFIKMERSGSPSVLMLADVIRPQCTVTGWLRRAKSRPHRHPGRERKNG